jgi:hypothetical protein
MGRSGSTLLQRVLNVHPTLTIWGEHGGFLKGLVDAYNVTLDEANEANLRDGYESRSSVIGELVEKEKFKPWVSPFRSEDLRRGLQGLMLDLFTDGLTPDIRWGFKEIRYGREELAPLMELFPEAHLVILARDLEGYASSRFFSFGRNANFDFLSSEGKAEGATRLERMSNGWMTRYRGLLELRDQVPDRTSVVAYSDLVSGSDRPAQLFAELGEDVPSREAIEVVLGSKTGSSFRFNDAARVNRQHLVAALEDVNIDRAEYQRLAVELGL